MNRMKRSFQSILKRSCFPLGQRMQSSTSARNASTASSAVTSSRIAIAMSGGVDSSVAAHLLKEQYAAYASEDPNTSKLLGIHMSNWDYQAVEDDIASNSSTKCWEQDWKDAKSVAQHLNIPIVHTSFEKDYWNSVFEPYVHQIAHRHITPNPDVDCNRYIKFGVLKEYLWSRYQIDTLATGHYARIWDPQGSPEIVGTAFRHNQTMPDCLQIALDRDPAIAELLSTTTPTLLAARDTTKDQSYFLTGVAGTALHKTLFPLGELLKSNSDEEQTVRDVALEAQLPNATKRDSVGICFVGKRKHGSFVQEFVEAEGEEATKTVGQCLNVEDDSLVTTFDPNHNPSLMYATIGQGAKIGGASQKWFVVDKTYASPSQDQPNEASMTLWICPGTHHPALYTDRFFVSHMHWIAGGPPPSNRFPLRAQCRIRHLQPLVDCEIVPASDGNGYEIVTAVPLRGVAPGQACAVYVEDVVCLGGGPIQQRGPTYWDLQKTLPKVLHPSGHNDRSVRDP